MKRSSERILTTHVGRLERPEELTSMMASAPRNRPTEAAFGERLRAAVAEVVRQQAEAGVDIVNDGEFGKLSWHSYLLGRMDGFELKPAKAGGGGTRDREEFAAFYAWLDSGYKYYKNPGGDAPRGMQWTCTGPVKYVGQAATAEDIDCLKAAVQGAGVVEAFIPSTSPLNPGRNAFYKDEDSYHYAVADAMREEYRAIVAAGFILQIDDPRLPDEWEKHSPAPSVEEYRKLAGRRVEMVNHALQGIPEDRVRYHICWGSWHGPHVHDLPMKHVVDLLLKVKAQAYLFEAANARHEHEWQVWKDVNIPDGKILVPGVVAHATNVVEHPELVAWRIQLYASVAGRENVIAGTDCGLGYRVHPQIAWAKLKALAEGARLASRTLWNR